MNFRHRLFQRFRNTPVFIGQLLPFSFAPSHCPYRKNCLRMKVPINSLYFRSKTAASVARQYNLTRRTYGTEAVSVISTLRATSIPGCCSVSNNTSYIKPFRTNALELFFQEVSRHQPEKKMLRSYFEYNRRNGKCDVVKLSTTIEPKIVAYLLA